MATPEDDGAPVREIACAIIPWTNPGERPSQDRLDETKGLVEALGCELAFIRSDNLRKPSASHLLSGGLLDRLEEDATLQHCSMVIIDSALSPIQQRNLELRLKVKVIDRTGLILEIFGLRALTKEGRLQVELARQLYERSRLVRTWTHLERQRGGGGFLGGPGETQLEADKRMIDRRVERLKRDLKDVKRTRDVQRAGRKRGDTSVIALVGYTNSGKSTLFNRLTGADVLAQDMPFATLDPTIRRVDLPNLGEAALVDTVGFITDLPTHLIDSFRATLEETLDADLIIHVRDRASQSDEDQKYDVLKVLGQLSDASGDQLPPMIEAWNKVDLLDDYMQEQFAALANDSEDIGVPVSALTGQGLSDLIDQIETQLGAGRQSFTVEDKSSNGALRAWLYENTAVENETYDDAGVVTYHAVMSPKEIGQFKTLYPAARTAAKR